MSARFSCRLIALVCLLMASSSASCDPNESADQAGDDCFRQSCVKGLVCHRYKCMAPADTAAFDIAEDERERVEREQLLIAEREKEARLLRESGREVAVAVEEAPVAAGSEVSGKPAPAKSRASSSGAIRVVHTKGLAPIFAACRDDERLVSGGCKINESDAAITDSFPSHFSADDTVGARWNCDGDAGIVEKDMEAYALCARIAAVHADDRQ